jgi:hypothetical protein
MTNEQCRTIADAAVEADRAERALFEFERKGIIGQEVRYTRARRDAARIRLGDIIASIADQ